MGDQHRYQARSFEFGKLLLTLRTRTALTQAEFARALGVHHRTVQNWETGLSYPKAETLQRLIETLLRHAAFTSGTERTEALALWNRVEEDSPRTLSDLDETWFERTLALHTTISPPKPDTAMSRSIIDWGEAVAVPTLVGREDELQTVRRWIMDDRCRVVAIVGVGGIGKSSLATAAARDVLSRFEVVMFRSVHNAPALGDVIDQAIRAVAGQSVAVPASMQEKLARLVQEFRERRCLLIVDNLESIMQPRALAGTYRAGYEDYGTFVQALCEREHQSCLVLTSREKPREIGSFESRTGAVRTFSLDGLSDDACRAILQSKDVVATPSEVNALARMYGGNALALMLVAVPIREMFGGNVSAFLGAGEAFFGGVGILMLQQCARSTPLERAIMFWFAIEREPVPLSSVLDDHMATVPHSEVLVALESLRRRSQVERSLDQATFTLQPMILEFVTGQVVEFAYHEIVNGHMDLLRSHVLVSATAKDYVRRSQELLIATPLLDRLIATLGDAPTVERQLLNLLTLARTQSSAEQGYGPGNIVNLLRILRGHLRALDLTHLAIRQAMFQDVDVQDANVAGTLIEECVFSESFDAVASIAVSNGNIWAVGTRRGEVLMWTADGRTLDRVWQAHADMVRTLAFSPDGRTLITSGSWDGTLKLWESAGGALIWERKHHTYASFVAFAPDGHILASSGNDATVRIWDVHNGTQIHTIQHPEPISALAWMLDRDVLATGDTAGIIRLWDVSRNARARCIRTFTGPTNHINALAFAPDGHTLACAGWDGTVTLQDVADGHVRERLTGHRERVVSMGWSPDGRILASAGLDHTILLWDTEHGRYRAALDAHTGEVNGLAFTADGRSLLSSSEDGTIRVWDVVSGRCMRTIQGYTTALCDVAWSPDGAYVGSGGTDHLATIFAVSADAAPRALHGHTGLVIGVGWHPDGRTIASTEWNNVIRLWDTASGTCRQVIHHPDEDTFFDGLAWSPDGRRLAVGTYQHGIAVFDHTGQHLPWTKPHVSTWIRPVAWSPDSTRVAGGGADGNVYVWDATTSSLLHRLSGHSSTITSVVWSTDGTYLLSGSTRPEDGELFVWDVERGERVHAIMAGSGLIYGLAWGANDATVISGGGDGSLRWWDVQTGLCVATRQAHRGLVRSLRRSPDGTTIASCGDDGAIMLWDADSATYLRTLRRDRPYERMNIADVRGITAGQRTALLALGAVDHVTEQPTPKHTFQTPDGHGFQQETITRPAPTDQRLVIGVPYQSTRCIGRESACDAILALLHEPACRLLTLLGTGGVGKTRLAIEVALRSGTTFRDGVAFIALADISNPTQLATTIGETLAVSFSNGAEPITQLTRHLRDRHMLLVLDNFEQLIAGADLLQRILEQTPYVKLIVTSRERLDLQAEWLFEVEGLDYPLEQGSGQLRSQPSHPSDWSAVQLFIQRATQVHPRFVATGAALDAIVRICQHVAGMPLAIELAAASVRMRPPAEIERQLHANLDALVVTHRDVPQRHRSLRATFDYSWNLLSDDERIVFGHLAVFRGGCTTAAAERVIDATLPLLMALVDRSLLRREADESPSLTEPDVTEARFSMIEPLRDYAAERFAASADAEDIRQRHASYFTAQAEVAAAAWDTSAITVAIAWQRREHDNLRAALQWISERRSSALGLRLAATLWGFWRSYGYSSEGRTWLDQLLALDPHPTDPAAMAVRRRVIHAAAWLASDQHDYASATRLFEEGLALSHMLGDTDGETDLLINAARQARTDGHYDQATALLEDALARYCRLSGPVKTGNVSVELPVANFGQVLRELALVLRERGEIARARALLEECLQLHRVDGDRVSAAIVQLGLGDVARDQGDGVGVRTHCRPSLAIFREFDMQWAIGFALNNLALGALYEGDIARARTLIEESEAVFRTSGSDASLAEVLLSRGTIMRSQGKTAAAYAALRTAIRLAHTVGPRLLLAIGLEGLGSLLVQAGQVASAARLLGAAARLREEMGTPVRLADQTTLQQTLATARALPGGPAFDAALEAAQALPLDQIIDALPDTLAFDDLREG